MKETILSKLLAFKKVFSKAMAVEDNSLSAGLSLYVIAIDDQEFYSQKQLSAFLDCDKAHTSRTLLKLQEKGLIEPITSRNSKILLTKKGKDFAAECKEKKSHIAKVSLENVPQAEKDIFFKVLCQMFQNLENYQNGENYGK